MAPAGNPACHPAGSFISAVGDLHTDRVGSASLPTPPLVPTPAQVRTRLATPSATLECPLKPLDSSPRLFLLKAKAASEGQARPFPVEGEQKEESQVNDTVP
jgi:hypothetical protein